MPRPPVLLLSALVLGGCGHDAGPQGYAYSFGYACRDVLDCGPGMSCVERQGGTCWPLCRTDVDCGPGYACKSVQRHGQSGHDDVCVPR